MKNANTTKTARVSDLPPSVLRSTAPGYLLAGAAVVALGGWCAWMVADQTEAIHAAQARTPAALIAATPSARPVAALVELPPETAGAPVSQVTTTGAVVATRSATPEPTAPQLARAPAAPAAPAPARAPAHAETAASGARPAIAKPHHAPPPEVKAAPDDDNPYDTASAPTSAPKTASDRLFEFRK